MSLPASPSDRNLSLIGVAENHRKTGTENRRIGYNQENHRTHHNQENRRIHHNPENRRKKECAHLVIDYIDWQTNNSTHQQLYALIENIF